MEEDMDDNKQNAKNLVMQAKSAANAGNLLESMKLFEKAYTLFPSEKIKIRMTKLKEFINSQNESEDEEDEGLVDIGNQFYIHKSIAENLYQYQKEGVLWFWKLYKRNAGGILGDDMGLGKTIQVIAFLAGMFDAELIKTVIIVAPLAVLVNWEKEFEKWAPGVSVKSYHGKKKERETNLKKVQKSRGVLLTTYGMVLSNADTLCVDFRGEDFVWDYIILDEGHAIRNMNKTSANVRRIPARFHYICTGTAIQNNLMEMWALFDFTQEGQLLGRKKTFEIEFQKPIVRAREKDANSYCQQVGNQISEKLREIIAPYFLRRTKAGVFSEKAKKQVLSEPVDVNENDVKSNIENHKVDACTPSLTAIKYDLIIWVYLSPQQLKFYQWILKSERVKETLKTTRNPLAELNFMKKICDHPRIQSTNSKFLNNAESQEGRSDFNIDEEGNGISEEPIIEEPVNASVESLIDDSGKMIFLVRLMGKLKTEGCRTVIFSQSRKMLDIIQKVLKSREHKLLRIDGSINNPQDREKILCKFRTDYSYDTLLMTTQIGSVGLNLTSANRLVIFDPSWNPGTDAQAVDRIYRLGQEKDVVIYRLITCGSVEEKIYRKQIFKNAIMKQATGSSNNPYRYFTNQELRELFVLDDPRNSVTQTQLEEIHPVQSTDRYFLSHLEYLKNEESVFGVSHHNLLFTEEATKNEHNGFEDQVVAQVQVAVQRVTDQVNDEVFSIQKKTKSDIPADEKKGNDLALSTNSFLIEKGDDGSNSILISEPSRDKPEIHNLSVPQVHPDDAAKETSNIINSSNEEKGDDGSNSILILEPSHDKPKTHNSSVHQIHPDSILSHSIDAPKETSNIINSSNEELYVSCIEDIQDKMNKIKIDSPSPAMKMSGQNCLENDVVVLDSGGDTDSEIGSKENCSQDLICHVVDTDLEESCDTPRDCSKSKIIDDSGIIFDSFRNAPGYQSFCAQTKVTPNLVHNLGKSYRTPSFSPLVKKDLMNESSREGRKGNRDASTPLDKSCFSSKQKDDYANNLHNTSEFKLDMYDVDVKDKLTPNDYSSNKGTDEKCAVLDDCKMIKITNESFVEVLDAGCSPIAISSNNDQKPISEEWKGCTFDFEQKEEICIDSKSFIDLQDAGCSPISSSLNVCHQHEYQNELLESDVKMTDTVPILGNSSNLIISSDEVLTDTVQIYNDFGKDMIRKVETHKPIQTKSDLNSSYTEILSEESENSHFDFARLEAVRELHSLKGKSNNINGEILNNRTDPSPDLLNVHNSCHSEMGDLFGFCKQQSKSISNIKLTYTENSPSKHMDTSPCKLPNLKIKDNRSKDSEVLVTLLKKHMNDDDVDDHVMMHIADLIELWRAR